MGSVSVRQFVSNPIGMLARVEQGETIEVTRHGKVIAVLVPGSDTLRRYSDLVAKDRIRLTATTTSDLDRLPHYATPAGVDPLDLLLAEREEDER
jgi:prevent-host-death family protein